MRSIGTFRPNSNRADFRFRGSNGAVTSIRDLANANPMLWWHSKLACKSVSATVFGLSDDGGEADQLPADQRGSNSVHRSYLIGILTVKSSLGLSSEDGSSRV